MIIHQGRIQKNNKINKNLPGPYKIPFCWYYKHGFYINVRTLIQQQEPLT